jgi:peptidoglycan hydrolase CwlO-like protein/surface antigen
MLKLLIKNKKSMSKKPIIIERLLSFRTMKIVRVGIIVACLIVLGFSFKIVHAVDCSTISDCTAQEQALEQQNSQNASSLSQLQLTAGSYQNAVNELQTEIANLEQEISINSATQASLQQQITQAQAQIVQDKQILSSDIKAMYVNGQMTTVEELATSQNLSDFVNAETYRNAVSDKIQETLDTITNLENKLQAQQSQVTAALSAQKIQQNELSGDETQQSNLLAYNQQQQVQFNQQIQSNQAGITQLQARIAALNMPKGSDITAGGVCGGGYPTSTTSTISGVRWGCDYSQDNTVDNWGMDNRECVSYTAFMVHEEYLSGEVSQDMPNWGGVGDAYQWITDAESAGVPVDQTPKVGDIAIRPASGEAGDVGHAMYVSGIGTLNGQPAIYVQQYNANLNGQYSSGLRASAGLYFLHFSEWQ